jgi:predicted metalloprotease with PDZ domain
MIINSFPNIIYSLSIPDPISKLFYISIKINKIPALINEIIFKLPVWRSGRYLIFDFAGSVQEFSAFNHNNEKLNWQKTDKSTWAVKKNGNSIIIKYKVYANEINLRTKGIEANHAFVNGAAVFMYAEKFQKKPILLNIKPYKNWQVTTGLDNYNNSKNTFYAPNYNYLIDCPIEIGMHKNYEFYVEGKKHTICFYGSANYNINQIINDFTIIIKKNYEFWKWIPYEHYTFIIHCTPYSGGGTEHINSTVVGVKPSAFESAERYMNFLRLISHEFFHTWNVKQLKPAGLTPYDWSKENYTSELWIAEGATSYYDRLIITRTKQSKSEIFFQQIEKWVEDDYTRPGNRIQSLAECSFDAWIKFWKHSENQYYSETDYYLKGAYVSMLLDLEIRYSSKNKYSLDDVFRYMLKKFPLDIKGYKNDNFKSACEKFANKKLDNFFMNYVYGTKKINWNKYLSYAGLDININDSVFKAVLGLHCIKSGDKIIVIKVLKNSSAHKAGILPKDQLIAFNDKKLNFEIAEKFISDMKYNEKLKITYIRNNSLSNCSLVKEQYNIPKYSVSKKVNPTKLQKSIYEKWLETNW